MPLSAVAARRLAAQRQSQEKIESTTRNHKDEIEDSHVVKNLAKRSGAAWNQDSLTSGNYSEELTNKDRPKLESQLPEDKAVKESAKRETRKRKRTGFSTADSASQVLRSQSQVSDEFVELSEPVRLLLNGKTSAARDELGSNASSESNSSIEEGSGSNPNESDVTESLSDSEGVLSDISDVSAKPKAATQVYVDVELSTVKKSAVQQLTESCKDGYLVSLSPGQQVVCVGEYEFWVRKGSVAVLGALIHASSKQWRIYAPSSHPLPVIKALQNPKADGTTQAEIVLTHCSSGVRSLSKLNPRFKTLWNGGQGSFDILYRSPDDALKRPIEKLKEMAEWHSLVREIVRPGMRDVPRIAICGSKGSGKSTLARFLCNAMLSHSEIDTVAVLDIDPGQPENSLCGTLSLDLLRDFNFGPPYTHPSILNKNNMNVWTHFYGSITPRDDTQHYIECIADLYHRYQRDYGSFPLVINFSGWILAGGWDVQEELLTLLDLTDIVYLDKENSIDAMKTFKTYSERQSVKLRVIKSASGTAKPLTSADLRIMQCLSYFHQREDISENPSWETVPLDSIEPQQWPWSGSDRCFDAFASCADSIAPEVLDSVIEDSILGIVLVKGDEVLETSLGLEAELGAMNSHDTETVQWEDSRANLEYTIDDREDHSIDSGVQITGTILRSDCGIPCYFPETRGSHAFDPSLSRTIGQLIVKNIDKEKRCLEVSTPLSRSDLLKHRENGSRVVLVLGRVDAPSWRILEPYYAAIADGDDLRAQNEETIMAKADNDTGLIESHETLNLVKWANSTRRVHLIDRADVAVRRRMKPWKTRRNLETSDFKSK